MVSIYLIFFAESGDLIILFSFLSYNFLVLHEFICHFV